MPLFSSEFDRPSFVYKWRCRDNKSKIVIFLFKKKKGSIICNSDLICKEKLKKKIILMHIIVYTSSGVLNWFILYVYSLKIRVQIKNVI